MRFNSFTKTYLAFVHLFCGCQSIPGFDKGVWCKSVSRFQVVDESLPVLVSEFAFRFTTGVLTLVHPVKELLADLVTIAFLIHNLVGGLPLATALDCLLIPLGVEAFQIFVLK